MVEIIRNPSCPVLTLRIRQKTTVEDTKKYLSEISNNLKTKDSFGLLFDFSNGHIQRERGVLKLENEWFKGYRRSFKNQCFGVAMVTNSFLTLNIWKNIAACLAKRTFGCEVGIFDCRSDAQMWLMDRYLLPQNTKN
ncbi:hypothetical protein VB796_17760 [Arcicella sp. LKC2W]|uniref:hypothetical protein n=1 Tax=Arcicella sp. LKC2W TaxID=2984198 RepID=UPI002B1FA8D6|nr:hypothetical protein [Arcicella sp. LKC2W]MEA5460911.1 hypothetical protein [Arcicella sp. LKC2W]